MGSNPTPGTRLAGDAECSGRFAGKVPGGAAGVPRVAKVAVVVDIIGAVGFAVLIIAVHEHGHRFAALLAGVPRRDVKVVLDARPPHAALWDGERWLAPDDRDYQATFRRHQPGVWWAWVFVAGGLIVETAAVTVATLLLVAVGADEVAEVLAATTLVLFVVYLAADVVLTLRHHVPSGDHSALWSIHPLATVGTLGGVATMKTTTALVAW